MAWKTQTWNLYPFIDLSSANLIHKKSSDFPRWVRVIQIQITFSLFLFIYLFSSPSTWNFFTSANLHLNLILFETFCMFSTPEKFLGEFYFTLIFFLLNTQLFRHGQLFLIENIKNTLSRKCIELIQSIYYSH